jgi:hypothetical protein
MFHKDKNRIINEPLNTQTFSTKFYYELFNLFHSTFVVFKLLLNIGHQLFLTAVVGTMLERFETELILQSKHVTKS